MPLYINHERFGAAFGHNQIRNTNQSTLGLLLKKTDSRPLEKKPGVPLKDLLQAVVVGAREEELLNTFNPDEVLKVGRDKDNKDKARELVNGFTEWMEQHKDELTALQIFYNQPFLRRELTYTMIKEVLEKLQSDKPTLAPMNVWRAYEALE